MTTLNQLEEKRLFNRNRFDYGFSRQQTSDHDKSPHTMDELVSPPRILDHVNTTGKPRYLIQKAGQSMDQAMWQSDPAEELLEGYVKRKRSGTRFREGSVTRSLSRQMQAEVSASTEDNRARKPFSFEVLLSYTRFL